MTQPMQMPATGIDALRYDTVADMPRRHARDTPDRIAMKFGDREASWAAFDVQCSRAAQALLAAGLDAGCRIAFLGKNSDRVFELFFGAAKAGMVLLPTNWRLTVPELSFILSDASAQALFVGEDYLDCIAPLTAACPSLRLVVAADGDPKGRAARSWDEWLAGGSDEDPRLDRDPGQTVLQMYTSGTTGLPKGAEHSHRSLLWPAAQSSGPVLGPWEADEVSVLPLPMFHVGGLVYGLNGPYAGCTTVVLAEPNPVLILRALSDPRFPATRLGVVPAVLQVLLDHPDKAKARFDRIRTLTYGGSPIAPALVRRALAEIGPVLNQLFGMTETATMGTVLLPSDHDPDDPERLKSCGRPLPGVEMTLVSLDGTPAGPGRSGEILIRCPSVMKGYWNRPDANRSAIEDGWYHTGDVGYLDAQGYLFIQDRLKDMIISGGENVYPAEVERVLAEHPAVADVAVIGVPDDKWGEAVKAVVVPRPGATLDAATLVGFARAQLAGYKCPKSVDFVDVLPRNATGKILKRTLREPYWVGHGRQVS